MFLVHRKRVSKNASSIRLCDYDSSKGKVSIRGQFTKTKTDRYVFLTTEMNKQIQTWLSDNNRTCHIVFPNETIIKDTNKKTQIEVRSPLRNEEDFIFSSKVGDVNNVIKLLSEVCTQHLYSHLKKHSIGWVKVHMKTVRSAVER